MRFGRFFSNVQDNPYLSITSSFRNELHDLTLTRSNTHDVIGRRGASVTQKTVNYQPRNPRRKESLVASDSLNRGHEITRRIGLQHIPPSSGRQDFLEYGISLM